MTTSDERTQRILARIERELGAPGLVARLTQLPTNDLASLAIEVQRQRARRVDPCSLIAAVHDDPFVAPSSIDARRFLWMRATAFDAAHAFEAIELSPIVPLGLCASVAPVEPRNIEGTARGREVISDPSNVLAAIAAKRRGTMLRRGELATRVDLCAEERVVRTPRIARAEFRQHFRLFALVSAARARPRLRFELEALRDHVAVHLTILGATRASEVVVTLVDRSGRAIEDLEREVAEPMRSRYPAAEFAITTERESAGTYYPGLSLVIEATDPRGVRIPVADGGSVGWTSAMLSDRKERCVISGIGIEVLCACFGAPT